MNKAFIHPNVALTLNSKQKVRLEHLEEDPFQVKTSIAANPISGPFNPVL